MVWLIAVLVGLWLTYSLARRILKPVRELDRGADEVAHGNYDYRVPVEDPDVGTRDELGRLAAAFNAMCASIQGGRQELIRQERIATIGRLSTSIVHDLRNPLAAIYGGAEMLIDGELSSRDRCSGWRATSIVRRGACSNCCRNWWTRGAGAVPVPKCAG